MCGHDGHTTCLLGGLALILEKIHEIPSNFTIRAFFQPAEEGGQGAPVMIQEGCLDNVDEVYGMHNMPHMPFKTLHSIPGPNMAEVTRPKITIIGKGGHGSDPKLSNNPIIPALKIYQRYLKLIDKYKENGRRFNSTLPLFKAGAAMNVVPDKSFISGTFRSLEEGLVHKFMADVKAIIIEECER